MMPEIWITDSFAGPQLGTRDNPFSVRRALELDALLASLLHVEGLALHFYGSFKTKGVYRWGQYATRNLGKGWTVEGDAEISLEPIEIDSQPIYCLAGPASRVSQIRTTGNHSKFVEDWTGTLRTGGVLLEGDGSIDGVTFSDFGSFGAETFVAIITGGSGEASIKNCVYWNHDPSASNDQVTVFAIMGMEKEPGPLRSFALMEKNQTTALGSKLVQAHTIYQTSNGLIHHNKSIGADVHVYGDYYATKGVVIEENEAENCVHGVQLKLSPTAGDDTELPKSFSHENYTIGVNRFQSSGANVSLDTVGPSTPARYIKGIKVHSSLTLENFGGEVTRFGEDLNSKKGCNPFRR